MKSLLTFSFFLIFSSTIFSQSWKTYPYTPTGSLISFPIDEGRHSAEPVEWWYTIGHIIGDSTGNHYSYMLTYFHFPQFSFDGFRILNLSNDDTGLFFDETKALNYNIMATDSLNIEADIFMGGTETWRNKTDTFGNALPFEYEISASASNGNLDLNYNSLKPPLILADSGFLHQGSTDYTYYYSQTKNTVIGTISFDGITENVTGTSWIDRQYGTFNPSSGQKYEWFSIQLSNDMDLNVWNIFTNDNLIPDTSTFRIMSVYVDDTTQYTTSNFEIERLAYHYMPDSLMCYSQKWRMTSAINNIDIIVSTLHSDEEVQLPFRFYEGATTITGTVNNNNITGFGFAELLQSYEKPDITITNSLLWNSNIPITWQLNNPDDGNPVIFDLEYSVDNQQTFSQINSMLVDTFYNWNTAPLSAGDTCWIKVVGYSIDTTLINSSIKQLIADSSSIVNNHRDIRSVSIYPNPSTGKFTIEGKHIDKIEVIDITGKLISTPIFNKRDHSIEICISYKGIYFVKTTTDIKTTVNKLIVR